MLVGRRLVCEVVCKLKIVFRLNGLVVWLVWVGWVCICVVLVSCVVVN